MIDFSKITKTVKGLDCHYLGQRKSNGQVIYRFAVFNDVGEVFCYYNEQGQRVECDGRTGKWVVQNDGHQIIAPPKIVEVTRWTGLFVDDNEEYHVKTAICKENLHGSKGYLLASKEHTFRFEVPND